MNNEELFLFKVEYKIKIFIRAWSLFRNILIIWKLNRGEELYKKSFSGNHDTCSWYVSDAKPVLQLCIMLHNSCMFALVKSKTSHGNTTLHSLINIKPIRCLQSNKCETPSFFSGSTNPNDIDLKAIRLEISNIRSEANKWY